MARLAALIMLSTSLIVRAGQESLPVLTANYPNAPVVLEQARFFIVETYAAPSQLPLPNATMSRSRIEYMNRKGLIPRNYQLDGTMRYRNRTGKTVDAVQLTFVFLNLFHERLEHTHVSSKERVGPRSAVTISWSDTLGAKDTAEVRLAVTAVRFSDGAVWSAPDKDLLVWPE